MLTDKRIREIQTAVLMEIMMGGEATQSTALVRNKYFAEEFRDLDWYDTIHNPMHRASLFRVVEGKLYEVTEVGKEFIKRGGM